jgi:FKBP-type peptidyl-prolyl cis-trans isomerase FkpA
VKLHPTLLTAAAFALNGLACQAKPADTPASPAPAALASEDDKTLYAIGAMLGKQLSPLKLTAAELEKVKKGFGDSVAEKTLEVPLETYGPKVNQFAQARVQAGAVAENEKWKEFREKAAAEKGAVKTASGLVILTTQPGTGASPSATDTVKVHYHGTLPDGTVFDSSVQRGEPIEFPLNGVIPCWTEGVQKMKVGEKAKLTCPPEIAYGERGAPPKIPAGATLVFEVELIGIKGK